jgi:hypothetical protein
MHPKRTWQWLDSWMSSKEATYKGTHMAGIILDVATIRSARRLLCQGESRHDEGRFVDLDITAVGTVVESIIMFDKVLVPNLGHQLNLPELLLPFGEAVTKLDIKHWQLDAVTEAAANWIKACSNIENFIRLLGGHPLYILDGDTYIYLLLQAIGVKSKYESEVVQWVRNIRSYDHRFYGKAQQTEFTYGPVYRREGYKVIRSEDGSYKEINAKETSALKRLLEESSRSEFGAKVFEQILSDLNLPQMGLGTHSEIPQNDYFIRHPSKAWLAGSEVMTFCANLAWTAFRSRCYDLISRAEGISYMPHPLRARLAGFSSSSDSASNHPPELQESFVRSYIGALEKVHQEARESISQFADFKLLAFPYSPLLPHILKEVRRKERNKAKQKEKIIEVAYEIRNSSGAKNIRSYISNVEDEVSNGNLKALLALNRELKDLMVALRQDIGLQEPSIPKIALSIAGVVEVEIPKELIPSFLHNKKHLSKPRLMFLRNVFDDLSRASSLGALYEILYNPSNI